MNSVLCLQLNPPPRQRSAEKCEWPFSSEISTTICDNFETLHFVGIILRRIKYTAANNHYYTRCTELETENS